MGFFALLLAGAFISDPDLYHKGLGNKFFRTDEELERIYNQTTMRQKRIRMAIILVPVVFTLLGSLVWKPLSLLPILFLIVFLLVVAGRIVRQMLQG